MKLLLDTHAFLWWVAASGELSRKARSADGSARNEPFDRLLVAQALEEDFAMVTADPVIAKYGVNRVW